MSYLDAGSTGLLVLDGLYKVRFFVDHVVIDVGLHTLLCCILTRAITGLLVLDGLHKVGLFIDDVVINMGRQISSCCIWMRIVPS